MRHPRLFGLSQSNPRATSMQAQKNSKYGMPGRSQILNCAEHIVIMVDRERNHDGNRICIGCRSLDMILSRGRPRSSSSRDTCLKCTWVRGAEAGAAATNSKRPWSCYGDRLCRHIDFKNSLADSSIFLLLRQIAGTPRESWGLRRIPYATLFIFSFRMLARKLP
jgi:hypothetical protein